jgi:magnesium-transporting ATPase (P-type)
MTVIVKSLEDEKIRVMCKGADSIIIPLLSSRSGKRIDKTKEYLDSFSKEGLRTLVIAEKIVSEEFYKEWNKDY